MEIIAAFLIIAAFISSFQPMQDISNDEVFIYPDIPGIELRLSHQVKPLSEFKDENIVKQQHDYSCGSAALATLLKYYLGDDLTEEQVIQGLMEYGDIEKIEQLPRDQVLQISGVDKHEIYSRLSKNENLKGMVLIYEKGEIPTVEHLLSIIQLHREVHGPFGAMHEATSVIIIDGIEEALEGQNQTSVFTEVEKVLQDTYITLIV